VLKAGLVAVMVFVCTTVGWLAVGTPRRPKAKPLTEKVASVPVAQPITREEPKAFVQEPPNVPKPVVPEPPKEPTAPPAAALTYERDILPIVKRSCLTCHGGAKKRGKLDLSTYSAARKGGEEGTSFVPGKPGDSSFLTTILAGKMPPGGKKLPAREVELIREWIRTGARSGASK
jgi:mono/diheme cytochrome c family protein